MSVGFQVTALFLAECSCAWPWGAAGVWLQVSPRAAADLRGRGSVTTARRTECAWTRVCAHTPLLGWHAGLPSGTDGVSSCRMLPRQRLCFRPLSTAMGSLDFAPWPAQRPGPSSSWGLRSSRPPPLSGPGGLSVG